MNILLFTSAANTSGGSRQALYLAQGMASREHNVLFFVPRKSSLPALAPHETFWRYLDAPGSWRSALESAMGDSYYRGGTPFVVHSFHNAAVKRAAWWGLFWKKRAVVVAHRGVIFRPRNPLPYWSPGIDAFLVNSRACGRVLQGMGVSQKRIEYVPNSVPGSRLISRTTVDELRDSLGIQKKALVFLCVGGNKPYKGVSQLLESFEKAFSDNSGQGAAHLVIVGIDPARWGAKVQRLSISKRIHCIGRTEDIAGYMKAADVFVLPSLSESMPNTLLEAVRSGLPCIGTAVGAVPDILKNCGLIVQPGDIPSLAANLKRMADEPNLRQTLSEAALVEGENYTSAKRLDLVERIYTDLLHRKGLI